MSWGVGSTTPSGKVCYSPIVMISHVYIYLVCLSLVGNAPVVLVKWKVVDDSGRNVLVIDNCGVLPHCR